MGTLGGQEMLVIIVLALLLFGPKELPKIARTLGKAMTEFRRAQNELKNTFSREMENLERETGVKELTATNYMSDAYSYNADGIDVNDSYYDSSAHSSDTTTYEADASATEGVEHIAGPLQIEAPAHSVPNGHVFDAGHSEAVHAEASPAPIHNEAGHAATETPVHG